MEFALQMLEVDCGKDITFLYEVRDEVELKRMMFHVNKIYEQNKNRALFAFMIKGRVKNRSLT